MNMEILICCGIAELDGVQYLDNSRFLSKFNEALQDWLTSNIGGWGHFDDPAHLNFGLFPALLATVAVTPNHREAESVKTTLTQLKTLGFSVKQKFVNANTNNTVTVLICKPRRWYDLKNEEDAYSETLKLKLKPKEKAYFGI